MSDLSRNRRRPAPVDSGLRWQIFVDLPGKNDAENQALDFSIQQVQHLGVSKNGGTPSYHPFLPYKPSSYGGTPICGNPQLDTIGGFCWRTVRDRKSRSPSLDAFCDLLGPGFWKRNHFLTGRILNDLSQIPFLGLSTCIINSLFVLFWHILYALFPSTFPFCNASVHSLVAQTLQPNFQSLPDETCKASNESNGAL